MDVGVASVVFKVVESVELVEKKAILCETHTCHSRTCERRERRVQPSSESRESATRASRSTIIINKLLELFSTSLVPLSLDRLGERNDMRDDLSRLTDEEDPEERVVLSGERASELKVHQREEVREKSSDPDSPPTTLNTSVHPPPSSPDPSPQSHSSSTHSSAKG
jgi:hypothetical protein